MYDARPETSPIREWSEALSLIDYSMELICSILDRLDPVLIPPSIRDWQAAVDSLLITKLRQVNAELMSLRDRIQL